MPKSQSRVAECASLSSFPTISHPLRETHSIYIDLKHLRRELEDAGRKELEAARQGAGEDAEEAESSNM